MKKLTIGILAHVDAGKTTLSEGLLYAAGALRTLGRVDHGDAFLDTEALERERGITIFAKQAVLDCGGTHITLLDTPGHVDFSAEAERTLQVLDYAILVISGTDGVQGHTRTLWRLLERYGVPTFLFINKMDLAGADRAALAFRVVSFRLPFLDRSQGGLRAYGLQEGRHVLPGEEHHEDAHLHLLPRSRRGLRRTPAGDDARRGYRALPERGSRSVFLPSLIADTHVSPKGGFDEQFGRHPELDRLAHLFMTNVATRGCVEGRRIPTSVVAS